MEKIPGETVTLVTGGTGAIGAAVCRLLCDNGQRVAFTFQSNDRGRDEILEYFRSADVSAMAQPIDLTNATAVNQFVTRIGAELGSVSTLIHASGPIVPQRFVGQLDDTLLSRHLDLEVLGFFNVVQACLPHLRERGGSVTAVTTAATRSFIRRDGLSSVPKAAVEAMVRAIASEEAKFGVRANCVGPGILSDGMTQDLIDAGDFDDQAQLHALHAIPLGRFGSALDVAQLVCFLSSTKAAYITGQMIDVDGGYGL